MGKLLQPTSAEHATLVVAGPGNEPIRLRVAVGSPLLDNCDGLDNPIPSCCRSAACGTCRVIVSNGAEYLSPAASDELDVLAVYDADPANTRLACQARICVGNVSVHVRAVDPP